MDSQRVSPFRRRIRLENVCFAVRPDVLTPCAVHRFKSVYQWSNATLDFNILANDLNQAAMGLLINPIFNYYNCDVVSRSDVLKRLSCGCGVARPNSTNHEVDLTCTGETELGIGRFEVRAMQFSIFCQKCDLFRHNVWLHCGVTAKM